MNNQFIRTRNLLGEEKYNKVISKKVIVFGVGGVGSATIEAFVRFGFKEITFVDYDKVDISNLNRQLFTTIDNVGMYKCLALRERINSINKQMKVNYLIKKLNKNIEEFQLEQYDYVIDAIDMITSKLDLIEYCSRNKINIISSMGTGNKVNPDSLKITDVYKTNNDPLAKVMRRELRKRRVKKLKVVSSDELPIIKSIRPDDKNKSTPFSASFVPPVSGYLMAGEVIRSFIEGVD